MLDQDKNLQESALRNRILDILGQLYGQKEQQMTSEVMRHFEKSVMLQVLDNSWKEHLTAMDYMRKGIHLRGYAQKDPKQEYKREAFEMFTNLLDHIKYEVTRILFRVQVRQEEDVQAMDEQMQAPRELHFEHAEVSGISEYDPQAAVEEQSEQQAQPFIREGSKVGRNDPCPCGSGKKFKQCHGKLS
jgi:preprotein translocase subunit SecA